MSDFNKVLAIVNDLSRTTCRQPVDVDEVDETRASVGKDAYRYFRFSLNADKGTGLVAAREWIELGELEGAAETIFDFIQSTIKALFLTRTTSKILFLRIFIYIFIPVRPN